MSVALRGRFYEVKKREWPYNDTGVTFIFTGASLLCHVPSCSGLMIDVRARGSASSCNNSSLTSDLGTRVGV